MERPAGSAKLLRAMNTSAVLVHLLNRGPLTRADIRELTGLSKPTTSRGAAQRSSTPTSPRVTGHTARRPGPERRDLRDQPGRGLRGRPVGTRDRRPAGDRPGRRATWPAPSGRATSGSWRPRHATDPADDARRRTPLGRALQDAGLEPKRVRHTHLGVPGLVRPHHRHHPPRRRARVSDRPGARVDAAPPPRRAGRGGQRRQPGRDRRAPARCRRRRRIVRAALARPRPRPRHRPRRHAAARCARRGRRDRLHAARLSVAVPADAPSHARRPHETVQTCTACSPARPCWRSRPSTACIADDPGRGGRDRRRGVHRGPGAAGRGRPRRPSSPCSIRRSSSWPARSARPAAPGCATPSRSRCAPTARSRPQIATTAVTDDAVLLGAVDAGLDAAPRRPHPVPSTTRAHRHPPLTPTHQHRHPLDWSTAMKGHLRQSHEIQR